MYVMACRVPPQIPVKVYAAVSMATANMFLLSSSHALSMYGEINCLPPPTVQEKIIDSEGLWIPYTCHSKPIGFRRRGLEPLLGLHTSPTQEVGNDHASFSMSLHARAIKSQRPGGTAWNCHCNDKESIPHFSDSSSILETGAILN